MDLLVDVNARQLVMSVSKIIRKYKPMTELADLHKTHLELFPAFFEMRLMLLNMIRHQSEQVHRQSTSTSSRTNFISKSDSREDLVRRLVSVLCSYIFTSRSSVTFFLLFCSIHGGIPASALFNFCSSHSYIEPSKGYLKSRWQRQL